MANAFKRAPDALRGGQVDRHALDVDRRIWRAGAVETHDVVRCRKHGAER